MTNTAELFRRAELAWDRIQVERALESDAAASETAFIKAAEQWALAIMTREEMEHSIALEMAQGDTRARALAVMMWG